MDNVYQSRIHVHPQYYECGGDQRVFFLVQTVLLSVGPLPAYLLAFLPVECEVPQVVCCRVSFLSVADLSASKS